MTVVDRLLSALPGTEEPAGEAPPPWAPGWRRSAVIGVATGLVSALLVVGPVLLTWRADPLGGSATGDALAVGSSLWLLAGGAHLVAGTATLAFTPLLAFGVLVLVARLGAREAMVSVSTEGGIWGGLLPRPLAAAVGAWWGGYVLVVAAGWVLAARGSFPPLVWTLALPAVLVPLLGTGLALRAVAADDPDVVGARLTPRLPETVRRGVAAGVAGAWVLVAVGVLVVLGAVVLGWPAVAAVDHDLGSSGAGTWMLDGVQVAALPNLAVWVVSFLAGPGFSVVEGASVTWSGVESGLLPLVPVLGALPQPQEFPAAVGVVGVLVLAVVGGWVARRSLGSVARLSRVRTKLAVALSACATTAVLVGLLDAVGGGSLGQFRLSSVGAPAAHLTLALFLTLLVGAVPVVLRDAWRLRR
ncbi:cell division protein PerM [Phycicoccus flavus]|uniref:Uncharacterized protein n=1 Tax=Phycicoccus flavus TaxID=2502783 RepID=A0A8T6R4L9_9MICO|nr:DUF6350 family protein [Phycicoccus flavus]NHA68533.1 hypothetical protein [Phycicoccus flavus]